MNWHVHIYVDASDFQIHQANRYSRVYIPTNINQHNSSMAIACGISIINFTDQACDLEKGHAYGNHLIGTCNTYLTTVAYVLQLKSLYIIVNTKKVEILTINKIKANWPTHFFSQLN